LLNLCARKGRPIARDGLLACFLEKHVDENKLADDLCAWFPGPRETGRSKAGQKEKKSFLLFRVVFKRPKLIVCPGGTWSRNFFGPRPCASRAPWSTKGRHVKLGRRWLRENSGNCKGDRGKIGPPPDQKPTGMGPFESADLFADAADGFLADKGPLISQVGPLKKPAETDKVFVYRARAVGGCGGNFQGWEKLPNQSVEKSFCAKRPPVTAKGGVRPEKLAIRTSEKTGVVRWPLGRVGRGASSRTCFSFFGSGETQPSKQFKTVPQEWCQH